MPDIQLTGIPFTRASTESREFSQKAPRVPRENCSIGGHLQISRKKRDLTLLNPAIDSSSRTGRNALVWLSSTESR